MSCAAGESFAAQRANVSDSCRPPSTSSRGATPLAEGAFPAGMFLKVRVFAMAATGCGRKCDGGWGLVRPAWLQGGFDDSDAEKAL